MFVRNPVKSDDVISTPTISSTDRKYKYIWVDKSETILENFSCVVFAAEATMPQGLFKFLEWNKLCLHCCSNFFITRGVGMVKGVDVKNHVAMVTFILVHYTKSLDETRAILHIRRSFEKGGI